MIKRNINKILISLCVISLLFFCLVACESNQSDQTSVSTKAILETATLTVDGMEISGSVPYSITEYSFIDEISVNKKYTWSLSLDEYGISNVVTKKVPLETGDNIFYIHVSANSGKSIDTYTVTIHRNTICSVVFDTDGGSYIENQYFEEGTEYYITVPVDPYKDNYEFIGWDYDFSKPIKDNITIKAQWVAVPDLSLFYYEYSDGGFKITGLKNYYFDKIVIPEGVNQIDDNVFLYCYNLKKVYYCGTTSDWLNLYIGSGNENLLAADIYFYSENQPVQYKYWHYENGSPKDWDEAQIQINGLDIYTIKIWCSESAVQLTRHQVNRFNSSEYATTNKIFINAVIQPVGEGEAATSMITDVEAGADIFCFAQDQFARLVQAGALSKLSANAAAIVGAANDAGTVAAARSGDELYAYPMTSDNGYFMYYDKSVLGDTDMTSLEAIIAACEDAGKSISFNLEGSAWYNAAFFFAKDEDGKTLCKSEWKTDDDGNFISVDDTYCSPEGLIAVKGMRKLLASSAYVDSSSGADFDAGSAVVITGTWDYSTVEGILDEDLGTAELPCFEVDGKSYHLGSFGGCKLMGVKPQIDKRKEIICHMLAQYLTSFDCQVERFEELAWCPANLEAQKLDAVKENPGLAALLAQSNYAVPQGQIHGSWWDIGKVIGTAVKECDGSDAGLQAALDDYKASIERLFNMNYEEKNAWTLIGQVAGTNWNEDFAMAEQGDGTWMTVEAYEFAAGAEFKVRKGKDWDYAYPAQNFEVTEAGTYYVKVDPATDEVTLVPAD